MKACSDLIFLTLGGLEFNKFKYIPYIRNIMLICKSNLYFFLSSLEFFSQVGQYV